MRTTIEGDVRTHGDETRGAIVADYSKSLPGSPAAMKVIQEKALAVVAAMGPPHLFITMTMNSRHPDLMALCTKRE